MDEGVTGRTGDAAAPIGQRLAGARTDLGMSLDDIAAATRIPKRHLATIEADSIEGLPALPYALGFVRSFARHVGLDAELAAAEYRARLNAEPTRRMVAPEPYEPADPARVPPKWLAILALMVALVIAGGYALWRNSESDGARVAATASDLPPASETGGPATSAATTPPSAAGGVVTVTATAPVWVSISERNGPKLFEREMAIGQVFEVPAAAVDPRLRTGRPQALAIKVGDTAVAPVGEPDRLLVDQSLKAAALLARPAPTELVPQAITPLVPQDGAGAARDAGA